MFHNPGETLQKFANAAACNQAITLQACRNPCSIVALKTAGQSRGLDHVFAMLSPRNVLGVPSAKIPIDGTTFVLYVLPPLVCYFAVAVLAVTPHMRPVRIALWPFVALLASRAVLSVDMSLGKPERKFLDVALVVSVFNPTLFKPS